MRLLKPIYLPLILAGFILPAFLPGCTDKTSGPVEPDNWQVRIEKAQNVLQGHYIEIDITMAPAGVTPGGFEFLIGYDASALAFTEAVLGDHLINCGWEYFTYGYNWNGNCVEDCPTGLVRLVGIAETNNGPNHPDYECLRKPREFTLATLTFFISNDITFECTSQPVQFYWMDCGDNIMTDINGDTLAFNRNLYDFEGQPIQDPEAALPGYQGAPDDPCLLGSDQVDHIRSIDFFGGGIDIICGDSIDARGDINDNDLPFEIADAVMLSDYFIYGPTIFGDHIEESTAASDVNADGISLSLPDLVYLIRVIVGDANPYPKPIPDDPVLIINNAGQITLDSPVDLGAVLFVFDVDGVSMPEPVLLAANMDFKFNFSGGQVRLLIYNIGSAFIPEGENYVLAVGTNLTLISAEISTYDGMSINCTW